MTITLINTSRRIAVISLIHDVYCVALGACVCTLQAGKRGIADLAAEAF